MAPRVSAIVVTYRSAARLPALLGPLRATVDELVVVDNASDDGSAALARRLVPDAVVVERRRNDGFAAGVNAGVAAATGDLLLLVNPDVRIDGAAVAALVAAAARHPGDVVGPRMRFADGRPHPSRNGLPTLLGLAGEQWLVPEGARPGSWPARLWPRWRAPDREEPGPVLSGAVLLIPRSAFDRVGPFDEGYFLYWEEVDWQVRAARAGVRSWFVPDAEVEHERGGSSGPVEAWRAEVFWHAARRFVQRQVPPGRRTAALAILAAGQLQRLLLWSVPPLRGRPHAPARRATHGLALRALLRPDRDAGRP